MCRSSRVSQRQVLQGRWDKCRTCWIKRQGPKVLQPCTLAPPNPACTICRRQTIMLRVDTNTFTLAQLFKLVLQKGMALNEPDVDVTNREYALHCGLQYMFSCQSLNNIVCISVRFRSFAWWSSMTAVPLTMLLWLLLHTPHPKLLFRLLYATPHKPASRVLLAPSAATRSASRRTARPPTSHTRSRTPRCASTTAPNCACSISCSSTRPPSSSDTRTGRNCAPRTLGL